MLPCDATGPVLLIFNANIRERVNRERVNSFSLLYCDVIHMLGNGWYLFQICAEYM